MDTLLTAESLKKYLEGLPESGVSSAVIKRKVNSIQRYIAWARDEDIITSEVYNSLTAVLVTHKIRKIPVLRALKNSVARLIRNNIKNLPQVSLPSQTPTYYAGIAMMLIIMAILGAGIYSQLFKQKITSSFAYPVTPTRGTRILSFQGRLTDTLSNPITATTDVTFKLYNVSSGGSPLYTGACTGGSGVDPDNDGIFNILIGSDCGMTEIPASVFTDNANVYLGITVGSDSEMSPRQQIANVGYALNSETLQGLPPGKNTSMIPYINDQGDVLLAASAPGLRSTYASATFTISSANAVTLASAGSGDITLNASQSGTLKFQTGGTDRITVVNNGNIGIGNVTNPSAFNVQVAGHVGPNATDTYDLGSVSQEWRNIYGQALYANGVAVCDANGNNCLNSGWTDDGSVVRLTTATDKVGIGTTNAVSKLHVTGAVTGKALAIFDETGDQGLLTASASGVTKFLVDHAGNVGIGVTNPAAKLDIKSGATNSDVLKLIASDGSRLGRFTETSGGAGWFEVDDAAGTAQALFRGDGAASYLLSGNFGIGTSSPVETLDVRGNASVSGNVVLAGSSRALQSTNFSALTIGGSTTGSILLNPNNGATGGLVAPTTTNVTDLGNSAQQFRNIYGQNLFVNGVAVCDANGNNCPSSSGAWTYSAPYVYPTASATRLGIGTTSTASMISQLYITRTLADGALGKALAIFNQTENQDLFTASASGTPRFTVTNAGNLQFHQASSITTTTGNLTLDSAGGTTSVSDNLVVTGTSDLQGAVSNSTGNVVLNDTTDIGSASTGVNVTTAGALSDIDGNLLLNDTVDLGSSSTGLNVTTAGALSDIDGNVVINDTTDIGSASTGINVTTAGAVSDIDGNLVLNDTVDIGSSANGLRVDTAGNVIDINGNIVLNDTTDIGSATTGINITTAGAISDTDGNISLNDSTDITGSLTLTGTLSDSNSDVQVNDNLDPNTDATFDLGDTTTSWNNLYLTGQICFDDTDCFSASPGNTSGWTDDGTVVRLTTATDQVGIGTATPTSRLHVVGKVTGKALAIFDETGDQAILTASASGTPRLTVLNDGTLQFHQASSITTTTGNLTLNSTGGTTTVSDNLVVTGTSDLQGAISSSTGNLVLDDTTDIGSATTGVNITTAGALSDTDGNLVLNDTTDIGSASTGINITTAGALSDIDGNLVLNDTVDIGSSANGLRVDTAGNVIDINGNIVLNDTTDIGSATTGLNVTTAGLITDTDGNVVIGDTVDLGSATTGINITTNGVISDSDGNISLNDSTDVTGSLTLTGTLSDSNSDVQVNDNLDPNTDATFDLGDTTTSWNNLYLTGQICFDDTDCFSASPGNTSGWTDDGTVVRLTTATDQVGIGTATPTSRLHVVGKVTGKALAIFDETGDQALLTASASGTPRLTVLNDGTLQFHQASSITTTTGNLTLNSTGGTTTISDNLVVTGTSDLQGAVANSTGNVVLNDTTDIGSASTGVNVTTAGALSDIDGNLLLNDTVDLGSASTGLNVTTAGALSDIDGNVVINDTTDIGSASTGINVTTAGALSDIDGNLVLNDTVDIGSSANGLRVDTAGTIIDINGNIVLDDTVDIGSATTGLNVTTAGLITDTDGNVVIGDTVDLGSASTGINITTNGVISDSDGNISLNDSTDITGSLTLTGTLSDSNSDVQVNDNLDPNADATFDLGDTTNSWNNIYLTGQICFDDSDCFSTAPSTANVGWVDDGTVVRLTTDTDQVGIGTATPIGRLHVVGKATGKAMAIFDETGDQAILTASASGTPRLTVLNDGTLQFHQASSITTTTGNLTLNSTGGTTTVSDNLVVTGTSDLQGAVSNSTGNVVLNDTTDIGSASTGVNVTTAGALSDIDGNLLLNDTVDLGSASTGLNVTTAGALSDIDGNVVINDTTDIGSASTGINVTTAGALSDIDGNLVLNDTVDIGSSANGLRVDTAGNVIDINGNIVLNDTTDIGSATTGLNVTTAGLISDTDGNVVIGDTVDLGSATTGINITTAGAISDTDGNISLNDSTDVTGSLTLTGTLSDSNSDVQVNDNLDPNTDAAFDLGDTTTSWKDLYLTGQICFDDTDCFSSSPANISGWNDDGTVVRLTTATDQVGIGTATPTSKLHVTGKITGKALTIFDETGDQALLTASASGVTKFTVSNGGDITFAGTTGLAGTGNGAGLNFSGTGTHTVQASTGTLAINAFTLGGTITGGNNNISAIGNITANSSSNTITGFGTIGTNGTTAFTGSTLALTGQFTSTLATGTAPMVIASTTKVTNLNADLLDGIDSTGFCQSGGTGCPTGLYVDLQSSTPGSQQTGNINISGAILGGYFADTSNTNYGIDPAGTSNFGGYSLKVTGGSLLALDSGGVGVGIGTPVAKLHVNGAITGKALAMFNETGDQALFTASASGTPRLTILNDGTLQFHQASSITTTTGNLTLNSTGGTTTVSDNLVITGTTDHQGAISDSNSDVQFTDNIDPSSDATFDIGDTTTSWRDLYLTGQICFDDTDCFSSSPGLSAAGWTDGGTNVYLTTTTDQVGIGTTTPVSKLHVTGKVTGKALAIFDETGDQALFTASASGVPKVTIDHNGNVGIGTTSPSYNVTIRGNTTTVGHYVGNTLTGSTNVAAGVLDRGDLTNGYALNYYYTAGVETWQMGLRANDSKFHLRWTDTIEAFTADTNGNIGLGTSSPTGKLHVNGQVTGKALAIFNENGDQALLTASASGVTKFLVDHNGNVGIGSTNNAGKLTLLQTGSGSTDGLYITNSLGNSGRGYLDSSSNLRLQTGTNNSQLVLHNGGNVGIGTTNPQAMLSVGSTSQFQVNSSGNLTSINGVTYSWPGSQGGASTVLTNNGSGTLTWAAATSGTVTGTGSAGQATFWTGTSAVSGDNSFWWDNTNKLFGLGTNAPVAKLHLDGAVKGKALAIFNETGDQDVFTASASGSPVFTVKHNGNVGIGTTAPTAKLEIAGTTSTISNTAGNINITPTSDLVVTSGNVGIGASPVSGGKLYLDTTNSNTINTVTMNIGNTASTNQNNWNTLKVQNGGTGFLDMELVRGFVNNQGINHIEDDFTGDSIDTGKWGARTATGTGASCTLPASVVSGVFRETTGTTAASSCMLRAGGGTGEGIYQMDNNAIYEAAVKMGSTANTQRAFFGFSNGAITTDANTSRRHAWIGKRAADTTWQCVTGNGTTETFTSTGVAISTTAFQILRVQLGGGSTNQVVCSVDGTAVSVTATLPGTGQLMDIYAMTESTGTSAVHDVDYVRAWQDDPPGTVRSTPQVPVAFDATQRADIAESYLHDPNVKFEPGDVVSVSDGAKIVKSNGTYDKKVLGVISTNPNTVMGMNYGDTDPVALNGRVPVKVTTANGQIQAGDYLTASSIPGVAMKATRSGVVIGKALESFTNNDPNAVGKVLMFINLTWYDPLITMNQSGDIQVTGLSPVAAAQTQAAQNQLIKEQNYTAQAGGQILTNIGGFAKVVTGTLSSGLVETQNAIVNGVLTAQSFVVNNITAVNQSVGTLTANAFTAVNGTIDNLTVTQKMTSPVVETQEVKTETIKPKNDSVVIDLSGDDSPTPTPEGNGKLAQLIIKGLEGKTVATIDNTGNATFSGTVTAKDASVSGQLAAGTVVTDTFGAKEASIAGTVKAKEIQADTIRGSQIDTIESNISKNDQAVKELSGNVNDIQKLLAELKDQPLPDPSYYQNLNQPVSASGSGQLQSNAGEAIFEKLSVTGYTILADAYVTNTFAAGDVQITGDSVISLASELKLSALNTINLFDGAVTIARDGSITTKGEVIAQGGVRTNDIKSVHDGEDIKVTLSKGTNTGTESNAVLASAASPKLKIQDGTGNEVASIDASGSAKFRDLALDQYLEATASSAIVSAQDNYNQNGLYAPAITTNGKTIGVGTLPANSNVIAIYNEKVSDKSLIYVTPTSPTDNKTLYIAEKVSCTDAAQNQGTTPCRTHFTVAISGTVTHDIQFNWWIVN